MTQLRNVLRDAAGGQRFLPNVVFAGGILLVVGGIIAGTTQVVLISAAHNHEDSIAKMLNYFMQNDELGLIAGMVILALATGAAILTNRVAPLPRTLGWWSL